MNNMEDLEKLQNTTFFWWIL